MDHPRHQWSCLRRTGDGDSIIIVTVPDTVEVNLPMQQAVVSLLRYPLIWFLLGGSLLFAADHWFADRADEIVIDDTVRNRLASLWQRQTGKSPSQEQLESLVDNWIREEVFYREALRLQLDRDDTIIRRRLVQKLTFIAEDVAKPDKADLRNWFRAHRQQYRLEPRFTFSQLFFSGDHAEALASAREALRANDADWRELGEPGMLNESHAARTQKEIESTFGDEFAREITRIEPGRWVGPIPSAFGLHLVRIDRRQPARLADFADVQQQVRRDYLRDNREAARREYYRDLLEGYEIVRGPL